MQIVGTNSTVVRLKHGLSTETFFKHRAEFSELDISNDF